MSIADQVRYSPHYIYVARAFFTNSQADFISCVFCGQGLRQSARLKARPAYNRQCRPASFPANSYDVKGEFSGHPVFVAPVHQASYHMAQ